MRAQVAIIAAGMLAVPFAPVAARAASEHYPIRTARAVALSDAKAPPDALALLRPGAHTSLRFQAKAYGRSFFGSDIQAYRWDGSALAPQVIYADRDEWRDPRGGRVSFDGLRFFNRTRHAVLVAGWCA